MGYVVEFRTGKDMRPFLCHRKVYDDLPHARKVASMLYDFFTFVYIKVYEVIRPNKVLLEYGKENQ